MTETRADRSIQPAPRQVATIDVADVLDLYRKYSEDLRAARKEQKALLAPGRPQLRPKLDDIEAELTYLLVREYRPAVVAEIGTFHGWSTTWLLRALRDNGEGELHSYDIVDHACRSVPAELSADRWSFHHGDVRETSHLHPAGIDYLFIDAAHTASFARWYTRELLPRLTPGTPTSVHDVYHRARAGRFSEGRVVLNWLAERGLAHFTASAPAARDNYVEIMAVKRSLDLADAVHQYGPNPMIYFRAG